jgi:autotransporter-associated beta strand protein
MDAAFGGVAGTVTLNGPVSAGNLFFNTGGYTITGNALTLGGGSISVASTATINSPLAGSSGLNLNGGGILTLNGAQSYTGSTTIRGTLLINGTNASTAFTVGVGSSAGTLGGAGSATSGTATVSASCVLMPGFGGQGSLTLNSVTFNGTAGGYIYITNPINYSSSAVLNVLNTLRLNGGQNSLRFVLNGSLPVGTGTVHLVHYGTLAGGGTNAINTIPTYSGNSRTNYTVTGTNSGYIDLNYNSDYLKWSGAGNGIWTTAAQAPNYNWNLAIAGTGTDFLANDIVVFDDSAGTKTLVSISGTGAVNPNSVTFSNSIRNYTLSGTYGITGPASLTVNGGGTVTISNSNNYSGGTILTSGRLNIANSAALGSVTGTLSINGGTLDNTSGGPLALPGYPIGLNNNFTFGGSNPLSLGSAGVSMTSSVTVRLNGSAALTIGGNLVGGGNGLSVTGPGMLVLAGTSSYTGATSVNSGTLSIGNGGSGAALNGTSGINLSNNGTLLFNQGNSSSFATAIVGTGNLAKSGSGTLTLSGSSTYSGDTIIAGGTLKVTTAPATSPVTGSLIYQLDPSNAATVTLSNGTVSQINDVLSGLNNNFSATSGTMGPTVLSGANGINGLSVMHFNGSNQLLLNTSTSPQDVFIVNRVTASAGSAGIWGENGTFDLGVRETSAGNAWQFGSGTTGDFAGPTNGGSMSINGTPVASNANGAFTLNTAQVLEVTNISNGGLVATGLGQYYVTSGTSLVPQRFYIGDIGEVLAYSMQLNASDAQQVTSYLMSKWLGTQLPANNLLPSTTILRISNSGTFDMANGTQTIAGLSSTDGSGSKVLLGNGVLTVANTANVTFDGVISGNGGSLFLQGPGKQVFSGANTYNGGTTVSGGTLQLGDGAAKNGSVTGNIALANNSALVFANPLSQTYSGVISGNGSLTKNGTGTLQLNGNHSYSGSTVINVGTLKLGSGGNGGGSGTSGFGINTSGTSSTTNPTWTFNTIVTGTVGYTASPVTSGSLTLTDGVNSERRTAFYNTKLPISGPFTVSFVYTAFGTTGNMADGATFTLQNTGVTAAGGGGGSLGYAGIGSSAAVALVLYPANGGGRGTSFSTSGILTEPSVNSTNPLNIGYTSGDPVQVILTYNGSTLTESATDLTTLGTFSTSYTGVNLASITGGSTAYVGFTGATGGVNSTQVISNFSFQSGTLIPSFGNILPATTDLSIASGATLDLNGGGQQVDSLNGAGTVTNTASGSLATLSVSGALSTVFSGAISNGLSPVSLIVTGGGTLTLSGTNTFSGGATVNGSTLIITNAVGIGDGSNLTVGDSTKFTSSAPVVPAPVIGQTSEAAVAPVPEPATMAILATGAAAALVEYSRRRRKFSAPERRDIF